MRAPIRSVAVLGGGIVGLSAAAAFARSLPQVAVRVIETPLDPAALAECLPIATTAIHRFHALIGLDEGDLLRSGAGMPRLGFRYEGWGGDPWIHVHGDHGVPAGTIPFHQLWARAWREGRALPYHRYAAAGVLAEAGIFVPPQGDARSPLSTYDYGLRIDPPRYRALLARLADALRVVREPGAPAAVDRHANGHVAALVLADGRRIQADLFLDASGPSSLLAEGAFEPWTDWLPFTAASLDEAPAQAPDPCDTLIADAQGWQWRAPLRDRTLTGRVGAGDSAIRPGRRTAPWHANVLALGDAAIGLDPLHGLPLHLAHSGIARALDLLPGRDCAPVETAEYNRRFAEEADRARDFAALHHRRWTQAPPPPSLARTLQQFGSRGRLPSHDEDSLPPEYWIAALIGLGVLPQATDPVAAAIDPDLAATRLARNAAELARLPAQLARA
jgi:tryptophan 7-halogenase